MSRILVTEKIADTGLARLRDAGHDVVVREALDSVQLVDEVAKADALIIRSATQVTADLLAHAPHLVVVGRAGIGLDNVDVEAATRAGVMVVNAPQSNVISAAEHTMALILAQARNVPQAHGALRAGRWERSKWEGVELYEKTLGVIGLGRIGKLVAQRALAFGMRLVAYDPFVAPERARQLNVELVELDALVEQSDFITIHVAKTPQTVGLIGGDLLKKAKPNLRVINVARGGIIDEAALAEAISEGRVAGAAIDVFSTEPITESPLFALDSVVVTPHLGASTVEAQDKAGDTIADQVLLALAGDFVPFAVNVDASAVSETVRPFLPLAEKLGRLFGSLCDCLPSVIEIDFEGEIGGYDNKLTALSLVKGLLAYVSDEPVSYVNAMHIARDRGVTVKSTNNPVGTHFVNCIKVRGGGHSLGATLAGVRGDHRLVLVDDHVVDLPPSAHMLVVHNSDEPGMVGFVGTVLGSHGLNIDDMYLGRSADGIPAMMVFGTNVRVPLSVQSEIAARKGIITVNAIGLA